MVTELRPEIPHFRHIFRELELGPCSTDRALLFCLEDALVPLRDLLYLEQSLFCTVAGICHHAYAI